jgi:hypothetical protein
MKPAYIVTLLASLTLASTSRAAWQRLGSPEKHPTDIASSSIAGMAVASSSGIAQPENLLSDASDAASKVAAGKSEVVYSLGQQDFINVVSLVNDGIEGKISISTSADGKTWSLISQTVCTIADRNIKLAFAEASTGYLKLQFELSKGGTVRQLGIFGARTAADFNGATASVNAASGVSGATVIYCHPSPVGGDDFALKYNRFDFPESDEKFRTLIYDLGKPSELTELGSVHSPRPVRFTAYAFDKLPEKEDWRHRMSFDPAAFDAAEPLVSIEDKSGVGFVKTKLKKSVTARYLALRWEPDFNPPGFTVSAVNIAVGAGGPAKSTSGGGAAGASNSSGTESGSGSGTTGNVSSQASGTSNFSSPFSISSSAGSIGGGRGLPTSIGSSNTAANKTSKATVTSGKRAPKTQK